MADAKWSDNTKFVPQASFGVGDHIMGLTAENVNATYPVTLLTGKVSGPVSSNDNAISRFNGTTGDIIQNSLAILDDDGNLNTPGVGNFDGGLSSPQVDTDVANVNDKLNLVDYMDTMSYVAGNGDDGNNGQIVQAKEHINAGVSAGSDGDQINVAPGAYTLTGDFEMRSGLNLSGYNKFTTTYTVSGALTIDQSQWTSTTSPHFQINNITLAGGSTDYTPTTYQTNSSMTFNSCNISPAFNGGNTTNLIFNDFTLSTPTISDFSTLSLTNGRISTGTVTLNILTSTTFPTSTIFIQNVDFNGQDLVLSNLTGTSGEFIVTIRNCRNINSITYDDGFSGIPSSINIDLVSIPVNGINDNSGALTITQAEDFRYANTVTGFGNFNSGPNSFIWTGTQSGLQYSFVAGEGAHTTLGTNNILLGNFSTSSRNGCFVWSDGTATPPANHFPSAHNQAMFFAAGGFGINPPSNTVQAGFHYGHAYSNDGNFLFSAVAAVADAKMANSEINPIVNTTGIAWKHKTPSGTVQTAYSSVPLEVTGTSQALSAGCEFIANNAALVTFTLPSTAAVGDKYKIIGKGAGLFSLAQNSGQSTVFLDQTTTSGTGGSLTATQRYQSMEITCITTNTGFSVTYASGAAWTVV